MTTEGHVVAQLRLSLVVQSSDEGASSPAILIDPELGQRIKLDDTILQMVRLLDRPRTLEDLASSTQCDLDRARKVVAFLSRLHLLATADSLAFVEAAEAARAWQSADSEEVPLIIRDDAAFTCSMCGSCCSGQNIGPVAPETVDALKPHGALLQRITQSPKGFFYSMPIRDGAGALKDRLICQMNDGACVFLGEDRLCTIHGQLGEHMKPGVCQIFPYRFVATPEGVSVSIRMECRGFVDARRGKKLSDQEEEIRGLLQLAQFQRLRPVIRLDGQQTLGFEAYMVLERDLHDAVDAHPYDSLAALQAMRQTLAAARRDPLEELRESTAGLREALQALVSHSLQMVEVLTERYSRDDAQAVVDISALEVFGNAVISLHKDFRRVCQPYARADCRALFRENAHHHLMGKELTSARTLIHGFSRFAYGWFLTKALVIHRSRVVKRRHIVPQDVMDALTITNHLLRNKDVKECLNSLDPILIDLFYHCLPELLEDASRLVPPDMSPELFKF